MHSEKRREQVAIILNVTEEILECGVVLPQSLKFNSLMVHQYIINSIIDRVISEFDQNFVRASAYNLSSPKYVHLKQINVVKSKSNQQNNRNIFCYYNDKSDDFSNRSQK